MSCESIYLVPYASTRDRSIAMRLIWRILFVMALVFCMANTLLWVHSHIVQSAIWYYPASRQSGFCVGDSCGCVFFEECASLYGSFPTARTAFAYNTGEPTEVGRPSEVNFAFFGLIDGEFFDPSGYHVHILIIPYRILVIGSGLSAVLF